MKKLLLVFSICLFAVSPAFAAPSSAIKLHPWWNLSPKQIKQYFAEGRAYRDKNKDIDGLLYSVKTKALTINNPSEPGYITSSIHLREAYLYAPPFALRDAGVFLIGTKKGNKIIKDDASLAQHAYDQCRKEIRFDISLDSSGSPAELKSVKFSLENSLGRKQACQNLEKPSFAESNNSGFYIVGVLLDSQEKKRLVSADTKWLRLWIIAKDKRLPVTFWIDGSKNIVIGKAE
jgi:hypothetical protein